MFRRNRIECQTCGAIIRFWDITLLGKNALQHEALAHGGHQHVLRFTIQRPTGGQAVLTLKPAGKGKQEDE